MSKGGCPIKFGTDGWRAIIADEFTFDNVAKCAQATADYLRKSGLASRGVVVGYDTRFQADAFADVVTQVLTANDVPVYLCENPAPTPVIGHAILAHKAAGSIVLTASHNPAAYCGFKVRTEYGGAAPPETLVEIEANARSRWEQTPSRRELDDARSSGLLEMIDPRPAYLTHLANLVDIVELRNAGLRVVIDPMHGAGAGYLRELLSGGTNEVWEVRGERNPAFPGMHNPEPIQRNLEMTVEAVRGHRAAMALCTDGDADRIGVIDNNGRFVTQLQTYALLAYYRLDVCGERGALVKSVTTTSMINKLGEIYGVPVHETGVGFKFLGPKMRETNALMAGEESGGFAFREHLPERDGVLSGLYMFDLMARRRADLPTLIEELYAKVGPHYYDRIDITMTEVERDRIAGLLPSLQPTEIAGLAVSHCDRTDGLRFVLPDGQWALIRLSGTEPLMRIYTEVHSEDGVPAVLSAVRALTGA
ncbi:MAG: phosphoglucomutase/phosphomannomutase family protein [Dehalococcoidia bacterium]